VRTDAPTDGPEAVAKALTDIGVVPVVDSESGGGSLDISRPLAVYHMDTHQGSTQSALELATMSGWRYIIDGTTGNDVAYADVAVDDAKSGFSSLSRNANAAALLEAAHLAQAAAEGLAGECEVRCLEIPAAKLAALWIVHDKQLFIPYIVGSDHSEILLKVLRLDDFLFELDRRLSALPQAEVAPDEGG
jgi:hypothetical protein